MRRFVCCLFILILLALSAVPSDVQAQQATGAICTVKWQADASICPNAQQCSIELPKQDNAGNLYIYSGATRRLLVIAPNGYRLSQHIDLPMVIDFAPTKDYIVLNSNLDTYLYKYSFTTNRVQKVSNLSTTQFSICYPIATRSWASLFAVGNTNQVVTCSVTAVDNQTGNATYGLNLVDLQSDTVTTFAELPTMFHMIPWLKLTAGADGFIYLQPRNSWPIPLPDNAQVNDFDSNHIVLKYAWQTDTWSAIRIPKSAIQELGELVFIDKASSVYFSADSVTNPVLKETPRITKVDKDGNVLWSVDVPDYVRPISVIGVTETGELLVLNRAASSPQIDQCKLPTN